MYSLKKISEKLKREVEEIEKIVVSQINEARTTQHNFLIEICFLKLVISWENFLEEYFLSCLCGCKTISSSILKPKGIKSKNRDEAFKKININRRNRDADYIDWLDSQKLKERVSDNFYGNSRLHKIYLDINTLNNIRTIRNLIAHNSRKSQKEFKKYTINELGYLPIGTDVSALLLSKKKNSSKIIFIHYIDFVRNTERILTK